MSVRSLSTHRPDRCRRPGAFARPAALCRSVPRVLAVAAVGLLGAPFAAAHGAGPVTRSGDIPPPPAYVWHDVPGAAAGCVPLDAGARGDVVVECPRGGTTGRSGTVRRVLSPSGAERWLSTTDVHGVVYQIAEPSAVDDQGDVVGVVDTLDPPDHSGARLALWSSGDVATVQHIAGLDRPAMSIRRIWDAGGGHAAVQGGEPGSAHDTAVALHGASARTVGGGEDVSVQGVADDGTVVGARLDSDGHPRPRYWDADGAERSPSADDGDAVGTVSTVSRDGRAMIGAVRRPHGWQEVWWFKDAPPAALSDPGVMHDIVRVGNDGKVFGAHEVYVGGAWHRVADLVGGLPDGASARVVDVDVTGRVLIDATIAGVHRAGFATPISVLPPPALPSVASNAVPRPTVTSKPPASSAPVPRPTVTSKPPGPRPRLPAYRWRPVLGSRPGCVPLDANRYGTAVMECPKGPRVVVGGDGRPVPLARVDQYGTTFERLEPVLVDDDGDVIGTVEEAFPPDGSTLRLARWRHGRLQTVQSIDGLHKPGFLPRCAWDAGRGRYLLSGGTPGYGRDYVLALDGLKIRRLTGVEWGLASGLADDGTIVGRLRSNTFYPEPTWWDWQGNDHRPVMFPDQTDGDIVAISRNARHMAGHVRREPLPPPPGRATNLRGYQEVWYFRDRPPVPLSPVGVFHDIVRITDDGRVLGRQDVYADGVWHALTSVTKDLPPGAALRVVDVDVTGRILVETLVAGVKLAAFLTPQ